MLYDSTLAASIFLAAVSALGGCLLVVRFAWLVGTRLMRYWDIDEADILTLGIRPDGRSAHLRR